MFFERHERRDMGHRWPGDCVRCGAATREPNVAGLLCDSCVEKDLEAIANGPTMRCPHCGEQTHLYRTCEWCDDHLPLGSNSMIRGEIFMASDGEVFDHE